MVKHVPPEKLLHLSGFLPMILWLLRAHTALSKVLQNFVSKNMVKTNAINQTFLINIFMVYNNFRIFSFSV